MFRTAVLILMIRNINVNVSQVNDIVLGTKGLVRVEKLLVKGIVIAMRIFAILLILVGIVFVHLIKTIWNFKWSKNLHLLDWSMGLVLWTTQL